ncbi:Hypothetical predicted protein [Marmota monax]|uniref:Uncharacterized protein n=1 Tax=Marmota monax TaxID=9995 RepID=A0A5E4AXT3_MARMO|nr:hypothetical protein GHT09_020081 [Marmota monax]VTJ61349.1 Hypothetical predicted protein [Marmota monax]
MRSGNSLRSSPGTSTATPIPVYLVQSRATLSTQIFDSKLIGLWRAEICSKEGREHSTSERGLIMWNYFLSPDTGLLVEFRCPW